MARFKVLATRAVTIGGIVGGLALFLGLASMGTYSACGMLLSAFSG